MFSEKCKNLEKIIYLNQFLYFTINKNIIIFN